MLTSFNPPTTFWSMDEVGFLAVYRSHDISWCMLRDAKWFDYEIAVSAQHNIL